MSWEEELADLITMTFEPNVSNTNDHPNCTYSLDEDEVENLESRLQTLISKVLQEERKRVLEKIQHRLVHLPETEETIEGYYIQKENWEKLLSELERKEEK